MTRERYEALSPEDKEWVDTMAVEVEAGRELTEAESIRVNELLGTSIGGPTYQVYGGRSFEDK